MKTVIGKPISPGYAQGCAVVMGVGEAEVPERHITQNEIDHKIARFQRALEDGYRELQRLQDRVQVELGSSQADIFSAHLLFLREMQLHLREMQLHRGIDDCR
jgi:phosphoenolpyruvate-protein kinase (PTS system EI component)